MSPPSVEDAIEIGQLLARYADGMTREDVDAVIDVFTPDGTYHAFGSIYRLSDFPALVAAAPKGSSYRASGARDRRRRGRRPPDTLLRRADEPRHEDRLLHRHLSAHRARVADRHAGDDVPAPKRCPRCRAHP